MKIDERRKAKGARRRAGISHMPAASLSHFFALAPLRSVPQAGSQFRFAVICCNR